MLSFRGGKHYSLPLYSDAKLKKLLTIGEKMGLILTILLFVYLLYVFFCYVYVLGGQL